MKKTIEVWQLIVLCVLLTAVMISMAFPVVSTSGERTWQKLDALDNKYKDSDAFDHTLKNYIKEASDAKKDNEKDYAERFDKMLEKTDIESSLSGIDILSGKAISKNVQERLDKYEKKKESERTDTEKQYLSLAKQYKKVRIVLGIFYFLPLLLIFLLILSYALKWNKTLSLVPAAIFSLLGAGVYGGGFFRFSDLMNKKILITSDVRSFVFYPKLDGEKFTDTLLQTSKALWNSFRGSGLLITGIVFVLILGMCIVAIVMKQKEMVPEFSYDGTGMNGASANVPGNFGNIPVIPEGNDQTPADMFKEQDFFATVKPVKKEKIEPSVVKKEKPMGRVVCIEGAAKGKGCKFPEENKVIVGADPSRCSVVIASQYVSGIHCSVRYNSFTNTYIVKDHSSNGSFVNGVRMPNGIPMEYPAGTILVLADGSNKIKLG